MQFQLRKIILSENITTKLINEFIKDNETKEECANRLINYWKRNEMYFYSKTNIYPSIYNGDNKYHYEIPQIKYYIGNKYIWFEIPIRWANFGDTVANIYNDLKYEYKIIEGEIKLKTWEMIKMLTENPKLKAKRTVNYSGENSYEYVEFVGNVLCWEKDRYYPFQVADKHIQHDEWEIIKEPVEFMTALKAFHEGKTIKCKTKNGCEYIYLYESRCLKNNRGESITTNEILCGTWYIVD